MRSRPALVGVLSVGLLAATGAYFLRPPKRPTVPAPGQPDPGYVDPARCSGCHADISETYRRTGMGRSFFRPRPENTVEDFARKNSFYHRASDRYYTMIHRDGKYYQRRHQIGFDGRPANIVEKEIHFVMGSGNHARTYLHRTPDGRLVELPVAWYAEKGGYWAMNPGYDRPDHDDFRRRITFECMFCHNAYPEIAPGADSTGTDPLFTGAIPEGIDCQRCHGPGREHVQAVEGGKATPESIRAAIVNPARLSPEKQLELCMQCHLESTSFRLPYFVRRSHRGVFSYRAGEPLADYILHFDHAPGAGHEDKFEIAHHAYRFRKSPCFQRSSGKLTCTTCHNPHHIPRGAEAVRHYTRICRNCHDTNLQKLIATGRHTASQDCLGCHMPQRRTDDVVHVAMTDHYIQRRKPARDLLAPLAERHEGPETAYKGEVMLYYPPQLPADGNSDLYMAVAQVKHNANLKAGIPRLERAIEQHRPERVEFYFELAEAYWNNGQTEKALDTYEEALRRKPDFWPALHNFGAALGKAGRLEKAAEILQKAVAIAPYDATTINDLAMIYLRQNRPAEAVPLLRKAVNLNSDLGEIYSNLGGALDETGDRAGAEAAFRDAIRVQPDLAAAHHNLANALAKKGDFVQAQYHFEKAIHNNPQYAEAHNSLGDMLAMKGQLQIAIRHYRRAVELKPEFAEARLNLGNALASTGSPREAIAHLRKAAESSDSGVRAAALESLQKITR